MFNVDFVFPYVNPNDPIWLGRYKYCAGKNFSKNDERFRDFSLLKYIFRSIELYTDFINRVIMIVSDESQVPDFLRRDYYRLRIVKHEDFIPKEFLPTFNSNTIELFIPNIQGLEQHFLYSNDDLLFVNKTYITDFYDKLDRALIAYVPYNTQSPKGFKQSVMNTWTTATNYFNRTLNLKKPFTFIKQSHGAASPRLLSECKACFKNLEPQILDSLTMFRNTNRNLNQYLYGYYSLLNNTSAYTNPNKVGFYTSAEDGLSKIRNIIQNCPTKMLCLNDTTAMTDDMIQEIYKELDKRFANKSSFEI